MHRFAVLTLCAFVCGIVAAPVPFPRPSWRWLDGWDRPVDPVGDCRFDRRGDRLTIMVPGRESRPLAPRLLRDVAGDFVVEVRVAGSFRPGSRAGLILAGGQTIFRFERIAEQSRSGRFLSIEKPVQVTRTSSGRLPPPKITVQVRLLQDGPPLNRPALLRLERRGSTLRLAYRQDGKEWCSVGPHEVKLPAKLKVGVVAEATSVFDQFRLSRLGVAKTR